MENHALHHHGCTHCACRNPIIELLSADLFNPVNFAALPSIKPSDPAPEPPALMISGGTIRPMTDGKVDPVESIGFADGLVVIAGTEDTVRKFMEDNHPGYSKKLLKPGQTLLPGLIEPHVHIVPTALMMSWCNLGPFDGQKLLQGYTKELLKERLLNRQAYLKKLEHMKKAKHKDWILGNGLDPSLMPFEGDKLIEMDSDLLDTFVDSRPVLILSASMHTLYLNTMAMVEVFKANKEKLNYNTLEEYLIQTKGQLQDADMYPALHTIPKRQIAAMFLSSFENFSNIFKTAGERGVTFLYDAGMTPGLKSLLDAYLSSRDRVLRIGAAHIVHTKTDAHGLDKYVRNSVNEDVYIGSIKVVSDGSNQGLTGYQSEEYVCDPGNVGIFNFGKTSKPLTPPIDYKEIIEIVIAEKGWPLMVHANGDLAVQFIIDVYGDCIPKKQNSAEIRHRIEHCSLATREQFKKMKKMGVSPSFLIGHVGYWGYAFKEIIFQEKSQMLDLCKTALEEGLRITLHSDNMVSPLGPLRMMEQSITRIMEEDPDLNVLNKEECIRAEAALRAITFDAAWQCHADEWTGSLIPGHFADFVILQQDPLMLTENYMNLRDIPVIETWVEGRVVYQNSQA